MMNLDLINDRELEANGKSDFSVENKADYVEWGSAEAEAFEKEFWQGVLEN